jgi:hypothetical protein
MTKLLVMSGEAIEFLEIEDLKKLLDIKPKRQRSKKKEVDPGEEIPLTVEECQAKHKAFLLQAVLDLNEHTIASELQKRYGCKSFMQLPKEDLLEVVNHVIPGMYKARDAK